MRLIDADALRNEVDTWGCNDFDKYDFLEAIDKAPTVKAYTFEEVESIRNEALEFARNSYERPQGKWIGVVYSNNRIGVGMCNQCGSNRIIDNFCPYCGADMRNGGAE